MMRPEDALPRRAGARARRLDLRDELRFFRSWAVRPLLTGAVSPSGAPLARRMAGHVDPGRPGTVIELGPGTGPVTRALIERGVDARRIVSIEYNGAFCRLLRERFPDVRVVEGDAYAIAETVRTRVEGPVCAIVSSLPLFARPPEQRLRLVLDALDLLPPGAPFIQFSYALVPPVKASEGAFVLTGSRPVWWNLPPARVWIYRRENAAGR